MYVAERPFAELLTDENKPGKDLAEKLPTPCCHVLSADGWLRTADIAEMLADGYVRLLDRKKDMILVSGFNVYPSELEDVISAHPGVERQTSSPGLALSPLGSVRD